VANATFWLQHRRWCICDGITPPKAYPRHHHHQPVWPNPTFSLDFSNSSAPLIYIIHSPPVCLCLVPSSQHKHNKGFDLETKFRGQSSSPPPKPSFLSIETTTQTTMSSGGSGLTNGSSSRAYNLTFEIEPPASVRPGVAFTLPVVVAVRPVGAASNNPTQQLLAGASLLDETGARSPTRLTGNLTDSVRSQAGNTNSGYACFRSLRIPSPGRYRLRIMMAVDSYNGTVTSEFVDSRVIHVHVEAAVSQRPSM
jgi:hypothetical protein